MPAKTPVDRRALARPRADRDQGADAAVASDLPRAKSDGLVGRAKRQGGTHDLRLWIRDGERARRVLRSGRGADKPSRRTRVLSRRSRADSEQDVSRYQTISTQT